MENLDEIPEIDWTDCPLVEINPRKVSGTPILKGSRMPAYGILENYFHGSPVEEIAENFEIPERSIREILAYAVTKNPALKV